MRNAVKAWLVKKLSNPDIGIFKFRVGIFIFDLDNLGFFRMLTNYLGKFYLPIGFHHKPNNRILELAEKTRPGKGKIPRLS